jgi:hypothetical protein
MWKSRTSVTRAAIPAAEQLGVRSLCHGCRSSTRWMGGRSFGPFGPRPRPLPVAERRPAHPNVSINHRVDALSALFLRLHAWMVPATATDRHWHFCPIHQEFLTSTLSCSDRGGIRDRRSRWCSDRQSGCYRAAQCWPVLRMNSRPLPNLDPGRALPLGTLNSKSCNGLLHNWGSCLTGCGTGQGGFQRAQEGAARRRLLAIVRVHSLVRSSREARTDDR